jgi:hypothetical protein
MSLHVCGSLVDLSLVSAKDLVRAIIQARGEQSACHVRTRLNQVLERRNGRRGLGGAKDRVLSNGAARAAIHG